MTLPSAVARTYLRRQATEILDAEEVYRQRTFEAGIREGHIARREGRMQSLDEVKRELGFE